MIVPGIEPGGCSHLQLYVDCCAEINIKLKVGAVFNHYTTRPMIFLTLFGFSLSMYCTYGVIWPF